MNCIALATDRLRRERAGHTLQPTALVNEVYLRLVAVDHQKQWDSTGPSSQQPHAPMRQFLIDNARRKLAGKRSADGQRLDVEMDDVTQVLDDQSLLELHEAISELEKVVSAKAQLVELKFFGGPEHGSGLRSAKDLPRHRTSTLEASSSLAVLARIRAQVSVPCFFPKNLLSDLAHIRGCQSMASSSVRSKRLRLGKPDSTAGARIKLLDVRRSIMREVAPSMRTTGRNGSERELRKTVAVESSSSSTARTDTINRNGFSSARVQSKSKAPRVVCATR